MIESRNSNAGRGAVYQYASQGVFLLIGFVFYAFLMHFFQTSLVGKVVLISTIAQILSGAVSLQLQNSFMHFISYNIGNDEEVARLTRSFLKLTALLSAVSIVVIYLLAPIFSSIFFHDSSEINLLRFSGVYLALSLAAQLLSGILYGLQWFGRINILRAATYAAGYGIAAVLAVVYGSVFLIIAGLAVGQFLFVVLTLPGLPLLIRKGSMNKGKMFDREVILYSTPLILTVFVGNTANHIDKLVAASLMSVSSLGVYNLALMVTAGIFGTFQSINNILIPKMSESYSYQGVAGIRNQANIAIRLLLSLYVPVSLALAASARQIVDLIGTSSYSAAVIPLQLILVITAVFSPLMIVSAIPGAIRKTKISYLTSPLSFGVNIGLSLLLIPIFGILGAAIGFAALYPVRFFILLYYSKKWVGLTFPKVSIIKIWINGVVIFLFSYFTGMIFDYSVSSLLVVIPVVICLYLLISHALKIYNKEDIAIILDTIPAKMGGVKRVIMYLYGAPD